MVSLVGNNIHRKGNFLVVTFLCMPNKVKSLFFGC